jgi:hypothetical protein
VPGDKWRFTTKPGKLFVILYQWLDGALELPAMTVKVKQATLLADATKPSAVTQENGKVCLAGRASRELCS